MALWCQGEQPGMAGASWGCVPWCCAAHPCLVLGAILVARLPSGLVSLCAAGALGTALWDAGGWGSHAAWLGLGAAHGNSCYTPLCG